MILVCHPWADTSPYASDPIVPWQIVALEGAGRCRRDLAGTPVAGSCDPDTAPGQWVAVRGLWVAWCIAVAWMVVARTWVGLDLCMAPASWGPREWAGRCSEGLNLCMVPGGWGVLGMRPRMRGALGVDGPGYV